MLQITPLTCSKDNMCGTHRLQSLQDNPTNVAWYHNYNWACRLT